MHNCTPIMAIAALSTILQAPLTSEAAGENKLEVFSWWTSGGEAAALNGLFNVYKKQDPGVEIVNATVAGGGGSAARPVLQTRLAGSNPPDSWQTHPGWELLGQYVEPAYCEPITELYKSDGWDKAFPKELVVNLMTKDRKIYAVLMEGKVAFSSMGDWADGEFLKANMKEKEDFGWVSHPGTDGSFIIVADGFTLAKGAPHKEAALAWLKTVGSKEAQEAFNRLKGSIPARTDVDRSKFDAYHQWSMDSFAKDKLVASCVHGEAAPAAFQQALNDAVTAFIVDKNVDDFANTLVEAAREAQIKK